MARQQDYKPYFKNEPMPPIEPYSTQWLKLRIQEFNSRFQVKEEFKVEGQNSKNPSSVVDNDTAEPIKKMAETNEEFLLIDQPIVIDDIAFDILGNTTEMMMESLPEGIQLPKESDAGTDRKVEKPVPG